MQKDIQQIDLFPALEEPAIVAKPSLPRVDLPELSFSLTEQLKLAFQNRDERALEYLLSDAGEFGQLLGRKDRFIYEYISYCHKLQQKYGQLFIQTLEGRCQGFYCSDFNGHLDGFSVSVHSVSLNKQLWVFNILCEPQPDGKLDIWKCHGFKVDKTIV
ncbi:MAG: hypothetical protein K1X81_04995 [Bacteroidia bacterium]|nr:hypothetical protein [Bacteroidia bacterium]